MTLQYEHHRPLWARGTNKNNGVWLAPILAILAYIGLSIGQFGVLNVDIPRLALMGSGLFLLIILFIFENDVLKKDEVLVFVSLSVYLLLRGMHGDRQGIWIGKIDGAILGGLFCFLSFRLGYYKYGERFLKAFLSISLIILIFTILYKIYFGFWEREVRFFINGPITFAWISGICSLISWYLYISRNQKIYLISMITFIMVIIWTGSKGPLIAITIPMAYISFRYGKTSSLFLYIAAMIAILYLMITFELLPERLLAITRLFSGDAAATDRGSILSRSYMLSYSGKLFLDHTLLGVGIGSWSNGNSNFQYPHNMIFELLSEHGLIGTVVLLLILGAAWKSSNPLGRSIFIFIFISLQFSGDISYWNYLLGIPLALNRGLWESGKT